MKGISALVDEDAGVHLRKEFNLGTTSSSRTKKQTRGLYRHHASLATLNSNLTIPKTFPANMDLMPQLQWRHLYHSPLYLYPPRGNFWSQVSLRRIGQDLDARNTIDTLENPFSAQTMANITPITTPNTSSSNVIAPITSISNILATAPLPLLHPPNPASP